MDQDTNRKYIHKVESLVKPQDVTAISFLGDFNKILPLKMQEKIMKDGSAKVPYMGFIVDPYCTFLAYEIQDRQAAQELLPEGYELAETRIFQDQKPCPLVVIGAFSLRTSAFMGNRLEFYIIARRKETGLISWIIADYETNTNSYDPKNGFSGYTSDPAVLTTTPYGELLAEFAGKSTGRVFSLAADLAQGQWRNLDQELWVDGNLSIDYGGDLRVNSATSFSLIFDPFLMKRALELPLGSLNIRNTYLDSLIGPQNLVCAAVFPYSQHFIIKQDLEEGAIKNQEDLNQRAKDFLEIQKIKTMEGDDIKKPLIRGLVVSALITYGIIIGLVIKVLSS